MKMEVKASLIKTLRNTKCWSQDELAEVAGLSLRTIQRIENKGVASQESIKALASAFEIDCSALLHDAVNPHEEAEPVSGVPSLGDRNKARQKLVLVMFAIIAIHLIALFGIYDAFQAGKLDHNVMSTLKNLVSLALLTAIGLVLYRGWKQRLLSV